MKCFTHIYTGDGKGKTTAALGLVLRALGHDRHICMIQFLKKDEQYGEYRFLKDRIDIEQFGSGEFIGQDGPSDEDISLAIKAYERVKSCASSGKYDIVIADEIIVACSMGLLSERQIIELIDKKHESTELVLTGRGASENLKNRADLVTEMKEVKHYFRKGIEAREGIEF